MKKQGKQYLVADKLSNGSVVCPNLFSAVVEYVAQRPSLTVVLVMLVPSFAIATVIMSVA